MNEILEIVNKLISDRVSTTVRVEIDGVEYKFIARLNEETDRFELIIRER